VGDTPPNQGIQPTPAAKSSDGRLKRNRWADKET
jgi:hypothetical protein